MSSDISSLELATSTHDSDVGPLGDSPHPSDTQDNMAPRQLSTFERLPLEIREMIYGYLGIVAMTNAEKQPTSVLDKPDARLSWTDGHCGNISRQITGPSRKTPANALTRTNHKIRAEVLDTLLRLKVIDIKCWLAESTTFFYQIHIVAKKDGTNRLWNDMVLTYSPFMFLRHVRLPCSCNRPGDNWPHNRFEEPEEMALKQASWLDHIAQHCPLLTSLAFQVPMSWNKGPGQVTAKSLDVVNLALKKIALQCQFLELLAIMDRGAELMIVNKDGTLHREMWLVVDSYDEDKLDLKPYKHIGRGDIVAVWAAAIFQEYLLPQYGLPILFVDNDEFFRVRSEKDSWIGRH